MKKLAHSLLFTAAWLLLVVMSKNYNQFHMHRVVQWDAEGYYLYLPAVFVYDGFEKVPRGQFSPYPGTDKIFVKFTCGVALLQAPFFAIANAYTLISKQYKPDGYTFYYLLSVIAAAAFYAVAGLFLLYPILRKHFSLPVSLFTLAFIFFGTNLYFYTIGAPGMSHVYSFFLFSLVVYLTPKILKRDSYPLWFGYGLTFGLLMLIRPTNGLAIFYPLLYSVFSFANLRERIKYFARRYAQLAVMALAGFIAIIPQLLYWKYVSGSYLMDSYVHESFTNWRNPYIVQVLFHPKNGWLLYTPIMLFALIGTVIALRNRLAESVPVPIILVLCTYLFASWWMWWFGGNFGHRCYVEYYSILAVPFASYLHLAMRQKWVLAGLLCLPLLACTFFNLELMYHYNPPWNGNWDWVDYWGAVKDIF